MDIYNMYSLLLKDIYVSLLGQKEIFIVYFPNSRLFVCYYQDCKYCKCDLFKSVIDFVLQTNNITEKDVELNMQVLH